MERKPTAAHRKLRRAANDPNQLTLVPFFAGPLSDHLLFTAEVNSAHEGGSAAILRAPLRFG